MKKIQILGPGCPKCRQLAEQTKAAADELGLACDVQKVTEITEITAMGAMMTPALAVDGEIKVSGRVPGIAELKELIS